MDVQSSNNGKSLSKTKKMKCNIHLEPYLKCNMCHDEFSQERIPIIFLCGHSVCTLCVENLKKDVYKDPIACPECQTKEDYPYDKIQVNHPVKRLLNVVQFFNQNGKNILPRKIISLQPTELKERVINAGNCPEHGHSMFFLCLRCLTAICRRCLEVNHPRPPLGNCSIMGLKEGVTRIKETHQKLMDTYQLDAECAVGHVNYRIRMLDFVYQHCKRATELGENILLEIMKQKEETEAQITTLEGHRSKLSQAVKILYEASDLQDLKVVTEDCIKLEKAFGIYKSDIEAGRYMQQKRPLPCSEGVKTIKIGLPVYAIQEKEGKIRWSEMIGDGENILMYSLRDDTPPMKGVHVPYELFHSLVPRDSPTVFMDFGGDGEWKGRSHFKMFGDTARGRQAVLLCSGERGPSYRNTVFFEMSDYDGSCLKGGDYENNDGSGGKAIVDDITDDNVYKKPIQNGMIVGWPLSETNRLGAFRMYTTVYDDSITAEEAFGIVTEGVDEVVEGIGREENAYGDPKVLDCGLVLSM